MEREISILLKVKGAEAAKKAVKEIFNDEVLSKAQKYGIATKKAGQSTQALGNAARRTSGSMQGFTKVLGRGMAALYLYNRAWNIFGKNFESGLQLDRASDQFERNIGRVAEMLPVLRSTTKGVIADFDLLKTANRAFQQGLKPGQMGSAFKMATVAAQRLGLSATDAINTVTNAITKQDEGALNTLGIITKVNQSYKTQAALVAKNGGVMSKAMSIQLRQNLIMRELNSRFGKGNAIQADGLQILERFKASWANFRAETGKTLAFALIPLTKALAGSLDMMTRFLESMNKTQGFQKFVQLAASLGAIWGASKFIKGAKAITSFLGISSAKGTTAGLARVAGFLSKITKAIPGIGRFIPGWGVALTAVTVLLNPLIDGLSVAWNMGKAFFQLLNNYDPQTGLSKILKEDKEALGKFYNFAENAAKMALELWAVMKGVGQGVSESIAPITAVLNWASDSLSALSASLFDVGQTAPNSASKLDRITNSVKNLVKWVGLGVSVLAMFVPGLQVAGALGASVFGGSILNDMGAGDAITGAFDSASQYMSGSNQMATAGGNYSQVPNPEPNSPPIPRSMNLDHGSDQEDLNKKILKVLEKQTTMMEVDSQKQDIRESQKGARSGGVMYRN